MDATLSKSKRIRIAGIELAVSIDERQARRVRRAIRPALRLLGKGNGHTNGHAATPERRAIDVNAYGTAEAREVARRAAEIDWYHVIELPHGVVTNGHVDHRDIKERYGLPQDMRGMRALEVATFDGYWSFEMERRGAEVVAVDIPAWSSADIPLRTLEGMTPEEDARTGAGFRLAKELLGSRVDRREMSVYDLSPAELGTFDIAFVSDLMLHLRDPQRAIERILPMLKPGGYLLLAEPYNPELEGFGDVAVTQFFGFQYFIWSIPSTMTLRTMLRVAGFDPIEDVARLPLVYQHPFPVEKIVLRAHRPHAPAGGGIAR